MSSVNGDESKSAIINTDKIVSKNATAVALGPKCKAKAPLECWLVISEWDKDCENIISIKTVKVDGKKIKANIWYMLKKGRFVKAGQ